MGGDLRQDGAYTPGYTVVGILALAGAILPFIARPPKHPDGTATATATAGSYPPAAPLPGRRSSDDLTSASADYV